MEKNIKKLAPIIIPEGKKYLDKEIMPTLPVNCLFNKGKTGCGGTELVINGNYNFIIAVPTKKLIRNKIEPNSNRKEKRDWILGVYQGVMEDQIVYYLKNHKIKKIMVTYDSLSRVVQTLNSNGENVYEDYFLLIDEYHRLFIDYSFRDTAINRLLSESKKFKRRTFMTATPFEDRFIINELRDLPMQDVIWKEKENLTLHVFRAKKILATTVDIINNRKDYNYHFFVNSVKFIASIINEAKLSPEEVRIVCADSDENRKKLTEYYKIGSTSDPVKGVNFYTSTSFEGEDIFDKNGQIIIISDDTVESRTLDISTSVKQIIGRIRDYTLPYVLYICPWAKKRLVTFKEYEAATDVNYKNCLDYVDLMNKAPRESREIAVKNSNFEGTYIKIDKETLYFEADKNKFLLDLYTYRNICTVRLPKQELLQEFTNNSFTISDYSNSAIEEDPVHKIKQNRNSRISFELLFKKYVQLKDIEKANLIECTYDHVFFGKKDEQQKTIEEYNPLVKEAYNLLSVEKVKELGYKTKSIKKAIRKIQNMPDSIQIKEIIKRKYGINPIYSWAEWKSILKEIYEELELDLTAKASDLKKWYDVKESQKKKEGKTTDYYTIIREKAIPEEMQK